MSILSVQLGCDNTDLHMVQLTVHHENGLCGRRWASQICWTSVRKSFNLVVLSDIQVFSPLIVW